MFFLSFFLVGDLDSTTINVVAQTATELLAGMIRNFTAEPIIPSSGIRIYTLSVFERASKCGSYIVI